MLSYPVFAAAGAGLTCRTLKKGSETDAACFAFIFHFPTKPFLAVASGVFTDLGKRIDGPGLGRQSNKRGTFLVLSWCRVRRPGLWPCTPVISRADERGETN